MRARVCEVRFLRFTGLGVSAAYKVRISLFNLSFPLATNLFSVSSIDMGIFMTVYNLVCSFQMTATLIFERILFSQLSKAIRYKQRYSINRVDFFGIVKRKLHIKFAKINRSGNINYYTHNVVSYAHHCNNDFGIFLWRKSR